MIQMNDVRDLLETPEAQEWIKLRAQALAAFDRKNPEGITNSGTSIWEAYKHEAARHYICDASAVSYLTIDAADLK